MLPNPIKVFKLFEGKYALSRVCSTCKKSYAMNVDAQDYFNWRNKGQHIQHAFPYLNSDQRELLISGICGTCFDNIFKEDDDASEERKE